MGLKRQKEIRADEISSFIENEITIKYTQVKFICVEQIFFEDIGPLGFLNQEHALVVYESLYFLCRYCDFSILTCRAVGYTLKNGGNTSNGGEKWNVYLQIDSISGAGNKNVAGLI